MIAFIAQFIIFVASLAVTTVCLTIWALLVARVWFDFWLRRKDRICGTAWAVFLWGTVAGLCGLGAFTILASATGSLLRML